jgi:hypothetical protein
MFVIVSIANPYQVTAPMGSDEAVDLGTFVPTNKEGFDKLAKGVAATVKRFQNHGLYFSFMETVVRELAMTVKDPVDVKKLASDLTALANEKQRLQKEKDGKKKKGMYFRNGIFNPQQLRLKRLLSIATTTCTMISE